MIWTMDQLRGVQGLRAAQRVSQLALHRAKNPDDLIAYVHRLLVRELQVAAEPWAVDLKPEHFEFRTDIEDSIDAHRIMARWRPSTTTVQFRGGPASGQVYSVMDAPYAPITVAVKEPTLLHMAWVEAVGEVTPQNVTYQLGGWNESMDCWVYDA